MSEDVLIDQQRELQARVVICRAYARALEDHLLDTGGDALATEYAARIVDHQAAIERLAAELAIRSEPVEFHP